MKKNNETLAVIPARGGSKGIPRKNISPLAGKPLIAYSILQALESKHISRLIVSTDDEEIAAVSRKWGAEVPFLRPAELAQDDTTDLPVFVHALKWIQTNENKLPNLVVHLRPTSPLRPPGLIERAIAHLETDTETDSVRTVRESPHTPYKMWQWEGKYLHPFAQIEGQESYNMPRQALPKVFCSDGVLDVVRTTTILEKNSMSGNNIKPLEIEKPFLTVDIDEPVDFLVAEAFIKYNQQNA
jgi:CMP-N,N'-diacetyllegionaminic acid synthase